VYLSFALLTILEESQCSIQPSTDTLYFLEESTGNKINGDDDNHYLYFKGKLVLFGYEAKLLEGREGHGHYACVYYCCLTFVYHCVAD
jgi:hypothetical protein